MYAGIVRRARELKEGGSRGVGSRYCFEDLRYSSELPQLDAGFLYALDNTFSTWYGRL